MMSPKSIALLCVLLLTSLVGQAQNDQPFALVELFTSQGCSSCPRADKYLSEIIAEADKGEHNVIALSYHVDYWNRLGWRDPYSNEENTQRQYAYARAMKAGNVYTPQMVVNGDAEFVGSDRSTGQYEINAALAKTPSGSISINEIQFNGDKLQVAYAFKGKLDPSMDVNIALVERGITTKVGRGENGGRTLYHDNVVRRFQSASMEATHDETVLKLPDDLVRENASLIIFVQEKELGKIVAADIEPLI